MRIPLSKPYIPQGSVSAVEDVLKRDVLHGDGEICRRVENQMEQKFGFKHVFLTSSCTHALEMAMTLLEAQSDAEVILPSFTFASTANAVVRANLKPVFADIDERTFNISPADIERQITHATRAVIVVHYAGIACEMDDIMELARENSLHVIEDAAHAVGATYKGRMLGGIGDIGCLSFHDTKNITCGEGGAFITGYNTLAARAEIIREKGTNRAQFLRGEVDKYTWVDIGSSFVLSEIQAAILEHQLRAFDYITSQRKRIFEFYTNALRPLEEGEIICLPYVPPYATPNYHIFAILLRTPEIRDALMQSLREQGIEAAFHFVPLHSSPFGKRFFSDALPVTDSVAGRLLRLPLFPDLSEAEMQFVAERVIAFFKGK